jgi:hypothetical protein
MNTESLAAEIRKLRWTIVCCTAFLALALGGEKAFDWILFLGLAAAFVLGLVWAVNRLCKDRREPSTEHS